MHQNNKVIGIQFPNERLWGEYQTKIKKSLTAQVDRKYTNSIFIDLTWFGPQYNNGEYEKVIKFYNSNKTFEHAFLLSTVDPCHLNRGEITNLLDMLGQPNVHFLGNFDGLKYQFDFFAPIIAKHFKKYRNDELVLSEVKYKYINYNRKPREHRVKLMRDIIENKLLDSGINTLGRPDEIYDKDPLNDLFLSVGEKFDDYVEWGHWYGDEEDHVGIPHDVLSLHNMHYWKHHFMHVIGATEFWPWDNVFVSESQYKPFIGLRPYIINGNTRTYRWLEQKGFKTFNRYFPKIKLSDTHEDSVHPNIIKVLRQIDSMTSSDILAMYNDMMPDLIHNKERFYEYAREQELKVDSLI